ncbi:RagB/SusD family nutrient uptake outer membrane protein [uncultured Sunxiuqinia sp.]|uniref:RagB/SusD family nutrient uptake outer membrane protein n=1 Tax=uncultured Sunxiuqinia sp. TaxID=1573825 RepID=UPI002AA5F035|nr:RagB/SusD family nutrient uptake outer membrane protein [uncultured Sunxiuqinia sp.]
MKNIIYILGIFLIFLLNSCEDLDREIITNISEEEVNTQYSYSGARAAALYTDLPDGFFEIDGALIASAGDEAEHTLETSSIQDFNIGSWNEISNPGDVWAKYFKAIRNVNLFLENSDEIDLEIYRLDPAPDQQEIYRTRSLEIERWKYEGRFLRAYYYFQLIKRYGGVPIVTQSMVMGDEYGNIQRSSLQECINFISSECDASAAQLPAKYEDTDLGRITKGAALALKAKVLLFAASELWNNPSWASGFSSPELISVSGDRNTKWKDAADAAKAVIDLEGTGYALADNYRNLFITGQSFQSPEHILVRRYGASNSFEKACWSIGFDLGKSGNAPSQNIVDAYEVKVDETTAVPFDWNNPDHAANPYANRDPRLSANVIVNNSSYKGRTMEIWEDGRDGKGKNLATKTGYYLKKFLDENINLLTGTSSIHSWSLIRLADVYLWYTEALNEYDPGNADIKFYLDQIRQRQGVNMPPVADGLTQDEMRDVIRHERMVELAFEGHRVWDLRRWMTATSALNAPLKGTQITKSESGDFTYSVITVENRVFEPKMYFYPISRQELLKMPNWSQNPLW